MADHTTTTADKGGPTPLKRIAVATDGSKTASKAVLFAAEVAERYDAELVLIRVIVPPTAPGTQVGAAEVTRGRQEERTLEERATELAGRRGRARVVFDEKPARGIVEAAEEEDVDVIVVGNQGMSGRKEFLLANVPNWVSHNARCTVIIVNTSQAETGGIRRLFGRR